MILGLALVVALSASGCAGKLRTQGRTMCESHGATYNAQTKQCTYPANQPPRNVAQICQAQGGTWDPVGDNCVQDYAR
jgi:hypothetical protein